METFKDTQLKNLKYIIECVKTENQSQLHKWGIQDRTLPEWLMYITEEVGELSEAISEYTYRTGTQWAIIKEATQAATLLLKIIDMLIEERTERLKKLKEKK